jgi:RNA polymerase sigma-70 factor (ECF subfamily)
LDGKRFDRLSSLETTADLLERVRTGEEDARDRLVRRFLPALQRWARGRVPDAARDLTDTDDLVQVTFLRALDRVEAFEPRGQGSFLAYLRRSLSNAIKDQLRRAKVRPARTELDPDQPAAAPSPLEEAIGAEMYERYEKALEGLSSRQQEAVILRVELGFTHREIADALGFPTPNAARIHLARALVRLVEVMQPGQARSMSDPGRGGGEP